MLTDLLWTLADAERARLSSLRIWYDLSRGWVVTLSYAGMVTTRRERDDDGVRRTDRERRPDATYPLALHGADPQEAVVAAVHALDASGLAGTIDIARYESPTIDAITHAPFPTWIIKTHAGSDAERATWLYGLTDAD